MLLFAAGAVVCLAEEIRWDSGRIRTSAKGELVVFVAGAEGAPAVLGTSRVEGTATVFTPRFPLQPGVKYRVVFRGPAGESTAVVEAPARPARPPTRLEAVYPSAEVLPENLLKLYLHFSAPMSRGEVYRRVKLLDQDGQPIELPFLELDQELWDPAGKRVTLLFDPGRVKRDLKPNREAGSPLVEGKTYTLVVEREWRDPDGLPLAAEHRKTLRIGPPDHEPPDPRRWVIRPPPAGTRGLLTVEFGESMDRALAERVIGVATARGEPVDGTVSLDAAETRWRFQPAAAWAPGEYWLRVEKILEDLAGNSIGKPFEVDVFERVEQRISREVESVGFRVP